jgi:hypothetical protein
MSKVQQPRNGVPREMEYRSTENHDNNRYAVDSKWSTVPLKITITIDIQLTVYWLLSWFSVDGTPFRVVFHSAAAGSAEVFSFWKHTHNETSTSFINNEKKICNKVHISLQLNHCKYKYKHTIHTEMHVHIYMGKT